MPSSPPPHSTHTHSFRYLRTPCTILILSSSLLLLLLLLLLLFIYLFIYLIFIFIYFYFFNRLFGCQNQDEICPPFRFLFSWCLSPLVCAPTEDGRHSAFCFWMSFQPMLHDWCNKGRGMCIQKNPCCYSIRVAYVAAAGSLSR